MSYQDCRGWSAPSGEGSLGGRLEYALAEQVKRTRSRKRKAASAHRARRMAPHAAQAWIPPWTAPFVLYFAAHIAWFFATRRCVRTVRVGRTTSRHATSGATGIGKHEGTAGRQQRATVTSRDGP